MRCPACGGESLEGKRFCADCGVPLGLTTRTVATPDEVRTVTVLFADVAGSTALAAQIGLEAVKAVMDSVFDSLYQVIRGCGGTVDKYIGDCVMALFGAPLAFGDDAARAVRAGLAIQRALVELAPGLAARGLPAVKMRVGINTGPVIAGSVGAGPERRYTVVGHAVNVAAHLQQHAPVGAVLVGHETYRRIRGLFYLKETLADDAGKAYQVVAERAGGLWLRPREILGREIDTVGRAAELEELMRATRACIAGPEARLVVVIGDPGIGKSRLLFEWLERLERELPQVGRLVGFAHPLSSGVPFSVAAEVVRRGLGLTADEPLVATAKVRAFLELLQRPSVEADQLMLARILGLQGAELPTEDSALFGRRVLDLLTEIVDWMTTRHPTVLVTEDLHWCDSSTLTLIDHALRRLAHKPLLIVGLARPELLLQHPELLDAPNRQRLMLGPLDRTAVAQLLDQAVGPESGQRLLDLVAASALGNPYHVEELLRSLEERRVLVRRLGGWTVRDLPSALEIPPGVEAVTQARIDNLGAAQRRLLGEAAVAGRIFWDGLLRHIGDEIFSPHDLSQLVLRELVLPRQESVFRGQIEYSFVHDLTRDVAYRMLPESRCAELHRRTAAWLLQQEAQGPEELAAIGRHLDLGGQPAQASAYLAQAGDAAFAAAAYGTATLHYGRAIELTADPQRLFELLARRERVLNALGRWSEQRHDTEQMLKLAARLGEEAQVEALLRVGRAQLNVGEHEQARELFDQALQLAARRGDPDGQARSLRWLAMYHFNRSEHVAARELFDQALQLADGHGLTTLGAELAYELGVTIGTIGDYPRALEISRRALEMFERQANRYQEAFCLGNLGCFHVYLGEYEQAVAVLQRAVELGQTMGIPLAEASAKANLGNAFRLLGRIDDALALERQAHDTAEAIGDVRLAADTLVYAALAALAASQFADAGQLAGRALERSRRAGMPGTEAAAQLALARSWRAQGQLEAAIDASTEAVQILDRIGSVEGLEPEILLVHAELCRRLDRPAEADACHRRALEEIARKAAFVAAPERRRRFVVELTRQAGVPHLAEELLDGP